jgi:hypothetical protein
VLQKQFFVVIFLFLKTNRTIYTSVKNYEKTSDFAHYKIYFPYAVRNRLGIVTWVRGSEPIGFFGASRAVLYFIAAITPRQILTVKRQIIFVYKLCAISAISK